MNTLKESSKQEIVNYIESMGMMITDKEILFDALDSTCTYSTDINVEEDDSLYVDSAEESVFVDEAIPANEILQSIGKRI